VATSPHTVDRGSHMLRRNGPAVKSVESVLRLEGVYGGKDL